jgi:secretion/DNA translocation related TadE-like protein
VDVVWRWERDRGAATVWVLACGLMTVLVALAMSMVGAGIVARHRAQGAADLGALAGAAHAIEGEQSACATAGSIAAANGARMTRCGMEGFDVIVTVEVSPALVASLGRSARASARAGPATGSATRRLGRWVSTMGYGPGDWTDEIRTASACDSGPSRRRGSRRSGRSGATSVTGELGHLWWSCVAPGLLRWQDAPRDENPPRR